MAGVRPKLCVHRKASASTAAFNQLGLTWSAWKITTVSSSNPSSCGTVAVVAAAALSTGGGFGGGGGGGGSGSNHIFPRPVAVTWLTLRTARVWPTESSIREIAA